MERSMEIKLVSARDLNNVNLLMKMDAYAVVKLVDDGAGNAKPKTKQRFQAPVDKEGGSNPIWNFAMKFAVDEAAARANRLTLVFKLRCQRNLGDRDIGEVYVPVKELLDSGGGGGGGGNSMQHLSYQVRKPSGNPQGVLNFGYKFGDNSVAGPIKPDPVEGFKPAAAEVHKPVSAYPVVSSGPVSVGYGYGGVYAPPPPKLEAYPPSSSNFYPVPPPKAAEAAAYPPSSSNFYPVPPPKAAEAEAYPPSSSNFYPVPSPKVAAPETGYSVYPQLTPSYSAYSAAPSYGAFSPTPPQPGYGYQHQPPPMAASYGYPPPPAYGYRPQPAYYPPPAQHKMNNMGLGLGAGLVGGMVGGLLIGDLVSDTAGYDAGFSDSGGFGF